MREARASPATRATQMKPLLRICLRQTICKLLRIMPLCRVEQPVGHVGRRRLLDQLENTSLDVSLLSTHVHRERREAD